MMDELGSAPRIKFDDTDQYNKDADQHGSWFGLAISGLKFLINNQQNNNINHNLNPQSIATNNNNNPSTPISAKNHNSSKTKKLHILGPSVFKQQLYDIPEYQSTTNSSNNNKNKNKFKTNARLTHQALQQLNGNFPHYWNQRSSFRSRPGSSNGDHGDDESNAGSMHTNQSHTSHPTNNTKTATLTDGGSSTVHHQTDEHQPFMTSSQIIHTTQDKQKLPKLTHSRSFPLLHSAEYIQNFQQFSKDIMIPNNESNNNYANFDEEGSQCNFIPSPPPISNTPDLNTSSMLFPNIQTVHPLKSWESVNSSQIGSVHSLDDEHDHNSDIAADGVVLTSQGPASGHKSLAQLLSDNHFIKEKQQSSIKQKQWLRQSLSAMQDTIPSSMDGMKSRKSHDIPASFDDTTSCSTANTEMIHVHHGSKTASEMDWTECNDTIIGQIISRPIPKSIKKNKKKSKKNKNKKRKREEDEEHVFSDWSNVSSNVGVTTPSNQ